MSSKKEEERNEKIIRGLMKLPPNRKCINCNSLGPQYVCTNFWTFVCIACSGIHREFTHRVKSVSMAKFTKQEVEALQNGGNQRAREIFLKDWDMQQLRLPDSSKPDRIREFIRSVYVEKKYAGGRSSDKPPRDTQSLKSHEDHRRASSYHSYSQSPPYDHQYEDRRYGKQSGMLTRKPGSDRGHYEGKLSSFMYSPGSLREQMYEDKFANESSGSRMSDYSASTTGDPFRSESQSPNFQESIYSKPPLQQARDIFVEDSQLQSLNRHKTNVKADLDGIPRPKRSASSGSFGSFDSTSLKSFNSGSLVDVVVEPDNSGKTQQLETFSVSSISQPPPVLTPELDLFNLPLMQVASPAPSIDLFHDVNHNSAPAVPEQKPMVLPSPESGGWATFDLPHSVRPTSEANSGISTTVEPVAGGPKGSIDVFSSMPDQWFSAQSSVPLTFFPLIGDQWDTDLGKVKRSSDPKNSQSWNAFDGSNGNTHSLFDLLPKGNELQVPMHQPPSDVPLGMSKVPKDSIDGFQISPANDRAPDLNLPFNGVPGPSCPPSVLQETVMATHHRKSTNPFDIPDDLEVQPNNMFLDMSSLQATLPNPQLPPPFLEALSEPFFNQNSVNVHVSSLPLEGLPYIGGQVPGSQLPNVASQGSVASIGGNPFA
ncbi:probable ADP-ribosylation factor GTPase-activating protein AGD14 isoform X1 [Dioscorea cayenensis subsp. rotundata]|uniref:Probable ADP-ribosylation factor GTPase-activating protein AGD14 isoform X1 n=1 Tax=Dioscorea cayennensis subsp. rotundata TaxID=55577 RepID=A0AB40BXQ9_DIOCR|nr:probable ADP-ribosylation factor GTPase-activating protein AGD14 isoform X1 [Dioscorea cayenensis subsp. rotundata]